jgi:hypothetical protein
VSDTSYVFPTLYAWMNHSRHAEVETWGSF